MAQVPVLRFTVEADKETMGMKDTLTLTYRLIYDAPPGSRPIAVHHTGLAPLNVASYLQKANTTEWTYVEEEDP